jgi:hypothetical protein
MSLVSVYTDGCAKSRHNREVVRLLRLLLGDGVQVYNMHHVRDGGLCKDLPLMLDGHCYDISYLSDDGELFLIEVMRVSNLGKGRLGEDPDQLGNG